MVEQIKPSRLKPKLTRIEEVKKILDKYRGAFICDNKCQDRTNETIAREICQLFPQPLDDEKFKLKLAQELAKIDGLSWDELDSVEDATTESVGTKEDYLLKADAVSILLQQQKPLDDKELREKIDCVLELWYAVTRAYLGVYIDKQELLLYADYCEDQILALLQPKIEEAKREERERIIKEIEGHACLGEANYTQTVLLKGEILINPGYLWWQALKRKE